MKKPCNVLFWDFDGTLVHHEKIWTNSLYAFLVKHNYNFDIEEVRQHLRKGYTWASPENSYTDKIGYKWWERLFSHLEILYNKNSVTKEDGNKINSCFRNHIIDSKNYILFESAKEVLHDCKEMGYTNYILSNNYPELPQVIKGLGISEYFTDFIISGNVGYEKPRIELFNYALKIAGHPENCFMIGDNPIADIQGGKSAGMKTIFVHNDCESTADYKCESISEIPLLIKNLKI